MNDLDKIKKYQLWYKISLLLGLVVLLDNIIYSLSQSQINIVPTIFLYTIGQVSSLSFLNLVVDIWSRSWIAWFVLAFVLNQKIKKAKELEIKNQ